MDFKTRIEDVLTETGFAEARPAKMTVDDLLKYVRFVSRSGTEVRAEPGPQVACCLSRHRCTLCMMISITYTSPELNWESRQTPVQPILIVTLIGCVARSTR